MHRDLGDLFVIIHGNIIVATRACRGGITAVECLKFLFICFVAVFFPRSETSRKGLEANVMPLMPLVVARAGSREEETMVEDQTLENRLGVVVSFKLVDHVAHRLGPETMDA